MPTHIPQLTAHTPCLFNPSSPFFFLLNFLLPLLSLLPLILLLSPSSIGASPSIYLESRFLPLHHSFLHCIVAEGLPHPAHLFSKAY